MKRRGNMVIVGGLATMLGPIAVFLFVTALPSLFTEGTVLFWHYFSAFGLIVYAPVGLILLIVGLIRRMRSAPSPRT